MSSDGQAIEQLGGSATTVDTTQLAQFDQWKNELSEITVATGALYMHRFIMAYEWTSKLSISLKKKLNDAVAEQKHQEAAAKLDRAATWIAANKDKLGAIKDSATLRNDYLALDEEYRKATDKVNAIKALVEVIDLKAETYRMAHDDAKKIFVERNPGNYGGVGMPSGGNRGESQY